MIDVHPDELKHCLCKTAFLYVHPNEYRPDGSRTAREAWVRIPGTTFFRRTARTGASLGRQLRCRSADPINARAAPLRTIFLRAARAFRRSLTGPRRTTSTAPFL
jgi:hypothetical protein